MSKDQCDGCEDCTWASCSWEILVCVFCRLRGSNTDWWLHQFSLNLLSFVFVFNSGWSRRTSWLHPMDFWQTVPGYGFDSMLGAKVNVLFNFEWSGRSGERLCLWPKLFKPHWLLHFFWSPFCGLAFNKGSGDLLPDCFHPRNEQLGDRVLSATSSATGSIELFLLPWLINWAF